MSVNHPGVDLSGSIAFNAEILELIKKIENAIENGNFMEISGFINSMREFYKEYQLNDKIILDLFNLLESNLVVDSSKNNCVFV